MLNKRWKKRIKNVIPALQGGEGQFKSRATWGEAPRFSVHVKLNWERCFGRLWWIFWFILCCPSAQTFPSGADRWTLCVRNKAAVELWTLPPSSPERDPRDFCFFVSFPVFEYGFLSFLAGCLEAAGPSGTALFSVLVPASSCSALRIHSPEPVDTSGGFLAHLQRCASSRKAL